MDALEKEIGKEHLILMQKRLELLIGGRIIERENMEKAGRSIEQLKRKVKGFDSVEAIRQWREKDVYS